jgi:hypothetical protein
MSPPWRIAAPGAGAIHSINGGFHGELLEPEFHAFAAGLILAEVRHEVREAFLKRSMA